MSSLLSLSITPQPTGPITPNQLSGPITPNPVPQTGLFTQNALTGPFAPSKVTGLGKFFTPKELTGPIIPVPVPQTSSPVLTNETLSNMTNVIFKTLIKEFSVYNCDVTNLSVHSVSWRIKSLCLLAEATHLLLGIHSLVVSFLLRYRLWILYSLLSLIFFVLMPIWLVCMEAYRVQIL
jgi:hypothetical protein